MTTKKKRPAGRPARVRDLAVLKIPMPHELRERLQSQASTRTEKSLVGAMTSAGQLAAEYILEGLDRDEKVPVPADALTPIP
jgi:hypothetical protein